MKFEILANDQCVFEDIKFVRDALAKFNQDHLGSTIQQFFIMVKDIDNTIIGGAFYWWLEESAYLDTIYIDPKYRMKGLGAQLIKLGEEQAIKNGCHRCLTDTFSFQAKGFYEKLGYKVFAEVPDYIKSYSRIYLKKHLT